MDGIARIGRQLEGDAQKRVLGSRLAEGDGLEIVARHLGGCPSAFFVPFWVDGVEAEPEARRSSSRKVPVGARTVTMSMSVWADVCETGISRLLCASSPGLDALLYFSPVLIIL